MSQSPSPEQRDTPTPEELDADAISASAVPASLRRAPKLGRVVGSGIAFGVGMGFVLGYLAPNNTGVGRLTVSALLALGLALIFGLVAAGVAVLMDARSLRRSHKPAWQEALDSDDA